MLTDEVKQTIQTAYRQLLERYAFTPRHGQRRMIAEISNCLASASDDEPPPVCVVEAGTGTGKTLAYVLAVLPLAKALNRRVVLTTATVALQEQVLNKDLPDILQGSALQFSFAMAKGRGRYLCLARLDSVLRSGDSLDAIMDLYGETLDVPDVSARQLYQRMLEEISSGRWQGDRDDWLEPVSDTQWRPVTVDNAQCMGPRCGHFSQCFFYRARESIQKVDCIVSNHDLLLSDLALGGGVILPDPEDTIYIVDEAHHLPLKSNNHFAAFTRIKGSMGWLQQCEKALARLAGEKVLAEQLSLGQRQAAMTRTILAAAEELQQVLLLLEQLVESEVQLDSYGNRSQHTFKLGQVPEALREVSAQLEARHAALSSDFSLVLDELKGLADAGTELTLRLLAEQWFPVVGGLAARADSSLKLWQLFARVDATGQVPQARWVTITEFDQVRDFTLAASPILAANDLHENLWQRCAGAVLTSATLSALGNFDVLTMRSGLPAHTRYLSIPSPFDFRRKARLVIPRMGCDPAETDKHTDYIIRALPQILAPDSAALMLFASRRQMQDVMQGLPTAWRERILCQDDYQKIQLLKFHRQRVDQGQGSVIFGLASFAEGVDLPGKYCTHVLIAKIPFAVPNDPVEMTLSDWLEQQGKNPFMTLAVPEAAFRLVQACGRLLRNETDSGTITLFDERLVSKFYGKAILESLPPYERELLQRSY